MAVSISFILQPSRKAMRAMAYRMHMPTIESTQDAALAVAIDAAIAARPNRPVASASWNRSMAATGWKKNPA